LQICKVSLEISLKTLGLLLSMALRRAPTATQRVGTPTVVQAQRGEWQVALCVLNNLWITCNSD